MQIFIAVELIETWITFLESYLVDTWFEIFLCHKNELIIISTVSNPE